MIALKKIIFGIFPIKKSETLQFILVTSLLFCILFIQNILKALKDTLVSTLIATEVITLLKTWFVVPSAILFLILYSQLINLLKPKQVFYVITYFFAIFFTFFAFYVFPSQYNAQYASYNLSLINHFTHLKWLVLIYKNWGCCMFYVIAELWQNIVYAVLFWQFVNFIHSVEQSRRFYVFFGFFGQTGLLITGTLLSYSNTVITFIKKIFSLNNIEKQVLCVQFLVCVAITLIIITNLLFYLLDKYVLQKSKNTITLKVKTKTSIIESLKIVIRSKNIGLLMLLLVSQGISISTIEPMFREQIKIAYPTAILGLQFTGKVLTLTGILTISLTLIGPIITRNFSWIVAAIIPNLLTLFFGILFFLATIFKDNIYIIFCCMCTQSVNSAIILGAIHNGIAKSTKYTFFDSTKEMFYVPLPIEDKIQGKACADVLGSKLGKSGIAFILQAIFLAIPSATFTSISTLLMIIFITSCFIWLFAIIKMNKQYQAITKKNN